jgi:predicted transcriptional regulator
MAMTLRLTDDQADALRHRAQVEGRSMHEIVVDLIDSYLEAQLKRDVLDRVLDRDLPAYADALRRLGE